MSTKINKLNMPVIDDTPHAFEMAQFRDKINELVDAHNQLLKFFSSKPSENPSLTHNKPMEKYEFCDTCTRNGIIPANYTEKPEITEKVLAGWIMEWGSIKAHRYTDSLERSLARFLMNKGIK